MNAHTCQHCRRVSLRFDKPSALKRIQNIDGFSTIKDLERAQAGGCRLAELLLSRQAQGQDSTDTSIEWYPKRSRQLRFGKSTLTLHLFAPPESPLAHWVSTRPMRRIIDIPETYHLIRSWLSECSQSHGEDTVKTCYTPARLLKLTKLQEGFELALVSLQEYHPYVALSYCWGGDQKHKTTRQHMPTRTIASSELPKTIQDAVHVAWELGQKYLWVDSMCLIQDDEEDKAREMAQMPQIYNSAVVTILAASAERASDGFLHPRPEPQVFQFSMQVGNEKAEVYGLEADDFGFPTPLDRRGWCLQERVLSNRILVFDRRHIRFKCTCARAPGRVHTDGWTSQAEGRSDFDSLIISKKESLRDIWNPIVEDYSQRQFTIASDRVVAISGVAARLASQVNDMYLAGHWSSSLPHDLLWQRKWDGATCRLFDGPTWSWTVAAGTVKLFKESTDTHSQERIAVFCDAKIELQHEAAPYGAVKQAILTVKGRIIKVECQNLQGDVGSQHRWGQERLGIGRNLHVMFDYYSEVEYEGTIYLLEIYSTSSEDEDDGVLVNGLVLEEVLPSQTMRTFTRSGTFTCLDTKPREKGISCSFFGRREEVIELV